MDRKLVVILGGGMSGLIAAYAFRKHRDVDVKIIDTKKPGGEFLAGGLKYIQRTDEMVSMFNDLGIVYTTYSVSGGIMLHEKVLPYPKCFSMMHKDMAARIQHDHYRKTRKAEPGEFANKAMNDPESTGPRKALRCDLEALVAKLANGVEYIHDNATSINETFVKTQKGDIYAYHYCVATLPLWTIKTIAPFHVPEGLAIRLNLVEITPLKDPYVRWDYVYTPYTPGDAIHRISPVSGRYSCEVNGDWDEDNVQSDLNFIFKDGFTVNGVKKGLNGHLLSLSEEPEWPENVRPIGRFAKWDPRSTSDVALADSFKLAEQWNMRRMD